MIRRALYALASCLILATAVLVTLALSPSTPAKAPESAPTPSTSAPHGLPSCDTEDGAGMALCWWDARTQGNGQGTSVISGDCAPAIMGQVASDACVVLHNRPSVEVDNGDGSFHTIPNGADLIGECMAQRAEVPIAECIDANM